MSNKITADYRLPDDQRYMTLRHKIDLSGVKAQMPFRLLEGIGTDWIALQMGQPLDEVQNPSNNASQHIDLEIDGREVSGDSIKVIISAVPFWPVYEGRSNSFGVSVDGCQPIVCENKFTEWSHPWKLQVLENRKDFALSFPIDGTKARHTLSLIIGDPGQMIQKISFE